MIYKKFSMTFHLYSPMPGLQCPGINEFDEVDSLFYSLQLLPCVDNSFYGVWDVLPDAKFIESSVTSEALSFSGVCTDGKYSIDFSIKVDSTPWPTYNSKLYSKSHDWARNGEVGQKWWIHHITLPDGSIIDEKDCERFPEKEVREFSKQFTLNLTKSS